MHGVHIAVRLLGGRHTTADRLRIVDPGPQLLLRWRARVAVTGMSFPQVPVDASPRRGLVLARAVRARLAVVRRGLVHAAEQPPLDGALRRPLRRADRGPRAGGRPRSGQRGPGGPRRGRRPRGTRRTGSLRASRVVLALGIGREPGLAGLGTAERSARGAHLRSGPPSPRGVHAQGRHRRRRDLGCPGRARRRGARARGRADLPARDPQPPVRQRPRMVRAEVHARFRAGAIGRDATGADLHGAQPRLSTGGRGGGAARRGRRRQRSTPDRGGPVPRARARTGPR